jgi:hypothetical protein
METGDLICYGMRGRGAGCWGSYVAHAHLDGGEDTEVVLGR